MPNKNLVTDVLLSTSNNNQHVAATKIQPKITAG